MQHAVRHVLGNFATFRGRTSRETFWWWVGFVILLMVVTRLIDAALIVPMLGFERWDAEAGQPLSFLVSLVLLLPNLAVSVRRLHDIGRTGWWVLIGLVPIIGFLVLLYFFVQPSDAANEHGEPGEA